MAGHATPACAGSEAVSAPHKSECPGGAGHIAEQNNHNINFPIFTHNSKDEKSVIAYFAIAGYSARPLRDGGYIVGKHLFHAKDLKALHAIAVCLGVCNA
jgi:hypothetical protein